MRREIACSSAVVGDRLVEEFVGARPHGLEHDRRVRLGGDDEKPYVGVLALDRRHRRRDGSRAPRIDNDDVRLLGGRVYQRCQFGCAPSGRAHTARTQELLQPTIERIDDEDFRNQMCGHVVYCSPYQQHFPQERGRVVDCARPLRLAGNRDQRPMTSLLPSAQSSMGVQDVRDRTWPSRTTPMMYATLPMSTRCTSEPCAALGRCRWTAVAQYPLVAQLPRTARLPLPGRTGIHLCESHTAEWPVRQRPRHPASSGPMMCPRFDIDVYRVAASPTAQCTLLGQFRLCWTAVIQPAPRTSSHRSSAVSRQTIWNQPDESILGGADLEGQLKPVVRRRIAVRIERREAGPGVARRWRECRHRGDIWARSGIIRRPSQLFRVKVRCWRYGVSGERSPSCLPTDP